MPMTEDAFIAAMRANPAGPGPLLDYCDWLGERGDPRGVEYRLLAAVLAVRPPTVGVPSVTLMDPELTSDVVARARDAFTAWVDAVARRDTQAAVRLRGGAAPSRGRVTSPGSTFLRYADVRDRSD